MDDRKHSDCTMAYNRTSLLYIIYEVYVVLIILMEILVIKEQIVCGELNGLYITS